MSRISVTLVCLFLCSCVSAWSAEKKTAAFAQRDLGKMIVTQFGWGDGLPKEATDRDYLVILGGKRTFRYEAENAYNEKTDNVTVRIFDIFGPFTGKGWLMGVSETTYANFRILLPIAGEYTLKATMKGQDFVWQVGDKQFRGSSPGGRFSEVVLGTLSVKPGVLQIRTTIPPDGAVDSFALVAKDYPPIQPFGGWRFSEPLTAQRLAEVGVALMDRYDRLPVDQQAAPVTVAAVDAALPVPDAEATTINYLGPFASRAWLRASHRGATVPISIKMTKAGYYNLRAQALGDRLTGDVNGVPFEVKGRQYLDPTDLGLFRLEAGDNLLTLKLPPMGGVDRIEAVPRSTIPADVMGLAGVAGKPDRPVKADEAAAYLKGIREQHQVRK